MKSSVDLRTVAELRERSLPAGSRRGSEVPCSGIRRDPAGRKNRGARFSDRGFSGWKGSGRYAVRALGRREERRGRGRKNLRH